VVGNCDLGDEEDLAYDWCEKYFELLAFVELVTATEAPPTVEDQLIYQCLREWLLAHEAGFQKLFKPYWALRVQPEKDSGANQIDCGMGDEDLFRSFYSPPDLYALAIQQELQEDVAVWDPNQSRAGYMRQIIILNMKVLLDFVA